MTAPIERRTAEQLQADAEARLRGTADLAQQLAAIRGSAGSEVRATVDVHGALKELRMAESALAAGPERLGEEIVRVAGEAQRAALYQGATRLGDALGDAAALDALRSAGLDDLIDPDAPVIAYVPGVDPNAHRWNVIE